VDRTTGGDSQAYCHRAAGGSPISHCRLVAVGSKWENRVMITPQYNEIHSN
jgi:hypothetical protein